MNSKERRARRNPHLTALQTIGSFPAVEYCSKCALDLSRDPLCREGYSAAGDEGDPALDLPFSNRLPGQLRRSASKEQAVKPKEPAVVAEPAAIPPAPA